MVIFIETVKNNPQEKSVREGSNKNVPIRFKSADRYNIQVRKNSNEEEKKGEKDNLGPPER
jgi:hypothetical protein